jgi:hypothetical protein
MTVLVAVSVQGGIGREGNWLENRPERKANVSNAKLI